MNQSLSVMLIHPILSYMARKGHDLESFYQFTLFDQGMIQEGEARIQEEEFDCLLEAASTFSDDTHLGLHLGQTIELSSLGILGYVLLHCGTIGEALTAYRRYNVIVCSGIDIEWTTGPKETSILFKVCNPTRQASRHAVEGMISSVFHILLKLSCRNITIHKLNLCHAAPEETTEYVSLLGVEPAFESESNLISIDNEALQYPILFSNRELLSTFEAYAEEARNHLLYGRTFADQVYKWITRCMPSTFPSVKEAAQHFNVSVRTLQAHLKQEQTTYNHLFNKARMEFAVQYLRIPRFTVSEIAYLLQFSEPSSFQSAFKKWTGLPPGQYRENCRYR